MQGRQRWLVPLCLLTLYLVWGGTFFSMKVAIASLPPLCMAALRFLLAGGLLYGWMRLRGAAHPSMKQWLGAALVGALLLACGNGGVAYAQQWVATGSAALMIATVPLWTVLFARLWGQPARRREWLGIVVGMLGVAVLHASRNLQASATGALVLMGAALCWAFGSMWGKTLPMPAGPMAPAAQMLAAGVMLLAAGLASGERLIAPPTMATLWAMLYLVFLGSLVAYSAYLYLLNHVRPALATSYAFVNPLIAMLLGWLFLGEHFGVFEASATALILLGVLLVLPIGTPFSASNAPDQK